MGLFSSEGRHTQTQACCRQVGNTQRVFSWGWPWAGKLSKDSEAACELRSGHGGDCLVEGPVVQLVLRALSQSVGTIPGEQGLLVLCAKCQGCGVQVA